MLTEGEQIYLLDDKGRRFWLLLEKDMIKVQGLGVIDGSKIVGRADGSLITLAGREFWALKATVVQQMGALDRGPQIITLKDAATVVFNLGLRAGEAVLEAGVGSGALTLALLNAVLPTGKVISVEVREDFAHRARRNIERAGLAPWWELRVGDVKTVRLDRMVDAVVLDMPDPWLALDNVERIHGVLEVEAMENIQRHIEVHPGGVRPAYENLGHTGYLVFARRVDRAQ
jgi:tRNA (adenine57-N1/adenine58-N1)-methyltransferase